MKLKVKPIEGNIEYSLKGMSQTHLELLWGLLINVRLGDGVYEEAAFEILEQLASQFEDVLYNSTLDIMVRKGDSGKMIDDFTIEVVDNWILLNT